MPRNAGFSVENNFSNGLVTEATGLNFPENAVVDTVNISFDKRGVASRRPGFDLEVNYTGVVAPDDAVYYEYLWESVAGDGNLSFFVQQIGNILRFYRATGGPSLSQGYLGSVLLTPFALEGDDLVRTNFCQFSTGLGRLVVVHPYCNQFYITFDKVASTFTPTTFTIQTRDFKGLDPRPVPRSSSLTNTHWYNLQNQGWDYSKMLTMYNRSGLYPSDYDVWWLYKSPDAYGTEVFLTDVAYAAGILNQVDRGNSPAPRGSYVLSEFIQDRSAASGVSGLPVVTSGTNRPTTTEFHAGRVFFSGVNAQNYSQKVYFSQILESEKQFGLCYQENDPTSQYSPDLLPSDGGVISIPEAGTIYRLWSVDNSLLVFASQGVWQITGSQGIGFAATDYTVKKLSTAATVSPVSFVKVDGRPVWWSLDDIYVALSDSQLGGVAIKSLTNDRIKTYYQDIPEESKIYAKGAYNNKDRVVQWIFRDTIADFPSEKQKYTKLLNFNTDTQAFYPWNIENSLTVIKGITVLKGQGSLSEEENVIDNGGSVITNSIGQNVTSVVTNVFSLSSEFKYTIVYNDNLMTFAEQNDQSYLDWISLPSGPVDDPGYFVSGYRVRGDAIKKSQANYILVMVDDEASQEFFFSSVYDYSINQNNGRWSSRQKLEFLDETYKYRSRRLKLRGHGKAIQFRVETSVGKGFNLVGWSTFESANSAV